MPKLTEKKKLIEEQLEEDSGLISWQEPETEPLTAYVNHVQALVGPWDFTLRFGHVIFGVGDKIEAKEIARIFVSPPHYKALVKLLNRQLGVYEERFGEILDLAKVAEDLATKSSDTPES